MGRKFAVVGCSMALAILFQNCSGVGFSSGSKTPAGGAAAAPTSNDSQNAFGEVLQGLKGGHFDLDTSSLAYPLSAGRTDHHVHEYDDKYNVTYADFFNLLDSKFGNITEQVAPDSRFVLIIANADLSPGGVLSINGKSISVVEYQKRVDAFLKGDASALSIFTLSGVSDQKLVDLKIGFAADTLGKGGLVGTQTSCVVHNDPGKLGEYRNGALMIQALDVNTMKINPLLRVAELNGGLLWESTLFWHWDQPCY